MIKLIECVDSSLIADKKKLELILESEINNPKDVNTQTDNIIKIMNQIAVLDATISSWERYTLKARINVREQQSPSDDGK